MSNCSRGTRATDESSDGPRARVHTRYRTLHHSEKERTQTLRQRPPAQPRERIPNFTFAVCKQEAQSARKERLAGVCVRGRSRSSFYNTALCCIIVLVLYLQRKVYQSLIHFQPYYGCGFPGVPCHPSVLSEAQTCRQEGQPRLRDDHWLQGNNSFWRILRWLPASLSEAGTQPSHPNQGKDGIRPGRGIQKLWQSASPARYNSDSTTRRR